MRSTSPPLSPPFLPYTYPSLSFLLFLKFPPSIQSTPKVPSSPMAAATIAVPCSSRPFLTAQTRHKPTSLSSQFPLSFKNFDPIARLRLRRTHTLTVCFVARDHKFEDKIVENNPPPSISGGEESLPEVEVIIPVVLDTKRLLEDKMARKKSERFTYLVAAIMSTLGITSMAVMAVYYRFSWQMEGGEIPYVEMFGTFALSVGAAVGMEYWARWAHEALWHASLWHMHESHHKPREGPFELNDVFAIINAVPAIALLNYGFFHKGIVPGLCFGAGSRCSEWRICSSTTAWFTKDSKWVPSQTFPTFGGLQPPISCITRRNLTEFLMACSWDLRSSKKWEGWRNWRRRFKEESNCIINEVMYIK
ncbi:hypothetical protein SSX86_030477 [Deinandra increscens subsp. villosa]|uniref:beta-carotene 3-hydroxylase n=1 Tax=Deinandra increscens subsp. villosa TaxID=3103831 RepID=A0AAP0C883_9ASTR